MVQASEITRKNLDKLGRGMSVDEILEFLKTDGKPRPFGEVLKRVCPAENLKEKLYRGLMDIEAPAQPEKQRTAIDNRVWTWLYEDVIPNKKTLQDVCTVLEADPEQAAAFIRECEKKPKRIREILDGLCSADEWNAKVRDELIKVGKTPHEVRKILDTGSQYCLDREGRLLPDWRCCISGICSALGFDDAKKEMVFDAVLTARRRFIYIAGSLCRKSDLQSRLSGGLYELEVPRMQKKLEDTVSGDIDNWLAEEEDRFLFPEREMLFKICYALELNYAEAEEVIGASGVQIHHRDPDELVYAYGLWNNLSWSEVLAWKKELGEKYAANMKTYRIKRCRKQVERLKKEGSSGEEAKVYSRTIHQLEAEMKQLKNDQNHLLFSRTIREAFFDSVDTKETFERFYEEWCSEFDIFHETAYRRFAELMELLQGKYRQAVTRGGKSSEEIREESDSEKISSSVSTVMKLYFAVALPPKYEPALKKIRRNWPTRESLYRMLSREKDVTREALILLVMTAEEIDRLSDWEGEESPGLPYEKTPEERMRSRMMQLKGLLDDCGMSGPDPRNPFDCIMLKVMRDSDERTGETVNDSIKKLMNDLFDTRGQA